MQKSKVYDIAQICINGHPINLSFNHNSADSKKFCPLCGATTITNCPDCHAPIPGNAYLSTQITMSMDPYSGQKRTQFYEHIIKEKYVVPAYCGVCGNQFPWTKAFLDAADEMVDLLEDLNDEQKQALKDTFPDLIVETPKSKVQALIAAKIIDGCKSFGKEIFISLLKEHVVASLYVLMGLSK